MAKKIASIVTSSGTITAVANGQSYTIPNDHANYKAIKEAVINDDPDALDRLVNVAKTVTVFAAPIGGIEVRDGQVYQNGVPLHNAITVRIFDLMREGFPVDPLVKFLSNLMANPSKRAVDELYRFLEHRGLPLTEDGCFLGYKRVRDDYTDNHTGKFDNRVGKVHEIPRNTVDDDWRLACSSGFHVGCIEYVRNFHANTGHVMIVKVNPADVVSVPENEVTKLRTCKYEVVSEYDAALPETLPSVLYTSEGAPVTPPVYTPASPDEDVPTAEEVDDEDEDYEDEDDEETNEAATERLAALAGAKGIDVYKLAYRLNVSNDFLPDNPTLQQVIAKYLENDYPEEAEAIINSL